MNILQYAFHTTKAKGIFESIRTTQKFSSLTNVQLQIQQNLKWQGKATFTILTHTRPV